MASQPPPESVILGQFSGLKNTVSRERLTGEELERALNIDLDDTGQAHRRRGYTLKSAGSFHSLYRFAGRVYGVKNGALGIIRPDYSFLSLTTVSDARLSYTTVDDKLYFSSSTHAGAIVGETLSTWGVVVEGTWVSPVLTPTETLGAIRGKLLGPPPHATSIAAHSGRIYAADDKVLWATELFMYDYVDKTRNYLMFEDPITELMAVNDGLYVGTSAALYFAQGVLGNMKLSLLVPSPVLPHSGVRVPAEKVHPQARSSPFPAGDAVVLMTQAGVCAGFDGGSCFNLTEKQFEFPKATSAAALFRQQDGASFYVAVTDSGGTPVANARIGDYADATIVRLGG